MPLCLRRESPTKVNSNTVSARSRGLLCCHHFGIVFQVAALSLLLVFGYSLEGIAESRFSNQKQNGSAPALNQESFSPSELKVVSKQPHIWSWQKPLGKAAARSNIVRTIRKGVNFNGSTPQTIANWVVDQIVLRDLKNENIAIIPQNFGRHDGDHALYKNPLDQIDGRDTVWMANGIEMNRDWLIEFLTQYKLRQLQDPSIPDPARVIFSVEQYPVPHRADMVNTFELMRSDPRWDTEPIPGFFGKTLATLYSEAGHPSYDVSKNWNQNANREWTLWFANICYTASDGAMLEAAYSLVTQAFPKSLSANYSTSVRYDGEGFPPRYRIHDASSSWYWTTERAFGGMQQPVFYWAPIEKLEHVIDANLGSDDAPVVPWVPLVNSQHDDNGDITEEMLRERLELLKSRDIQEVILWNDSNAQTEENWDLTLEIIDQVWGNSGSTM